MALEESEGTEGHGGARHARVRNSVAYTDALYATAFAARLCPDVVLRAFGTAYPTHRIILASQSAWFRTLLRWSGSKWQPGAAAGGAEGGEEGAAEDDLAGLPVHDLVLGEDVTQRGFEWILEYLYASPHVAITSDNAFDVLAAAHYLDITAVQAACVEFLSQHLDPTNFATCLTWATRADHGEASEMLAGACRRLLALRLPSNLADWAPALPHIEPSILLDILSSDCLAVHHEYERYQLVKEVAHLFTVVGEGGSSGGGSSSGAPPSRQASGGDLSPRASRSGGPGVGGAEQRGAGSGSSGSSSAHAVQRMLRCALHISDEGLARRLQLARSSPAALPIQSLRQPEVEGGGAAGGGGGSGEGGGGGSSWERAHGDASPLAFSQCASPTEGTQSSMLWPSSHSSSRSSSRFVSSLLYEASDEAQLPARGTSATGGAAAAAGAAGSDGDPPPLLPSSQPPSQQQEHVLQEQDALALALRAGCVQPSGRRSLGSRPTAHGPSGEAGGAVEISAAAVAQMLLDEAVRYEHLTVPQLMAVQHEGLVGPHVLHAALWQRTQLDFAIFCAGAGGTAGCGNSSSGDGDGQGGDEGLAAAAAAAAAAAPRLRPFRMCWRLPCRALSKLAAPNMLQSELQQYAGALWQVRLCGGDASRTHLGLYVGRHLAPAGPPSGARPLAQHGSHAQAQLQQQQQRHRQDAGPGRPPQGQQRQQQPQQHAAAQRSRSPFVAYTDRQSALRSRCRVTVFQPDNTALGGRLKIAETGDFRADFTAGAFFGQAKLLARSDLASLRDDSELLVFVELQALAG